MSITGAVRDRWLRLATRDRRAIGFGALALLPLLTWSGLVRPYLGALEEARTNLEAERALLAREEGLVTAADLLPGQLERSTQLLAEESHGLIHAENDLLAEAQLSDAIQGMAVRSRVLIQELRGIESDPASLFGGIETVRLALRAESDLEGAAAFLNRLENGPIRVHIMELSIEPVAARGSRNEGLPDPATMGAVSLALIVEAYWSATPIGSIAGDEVANTRLTGIPQ